MTSKYVNDEILINTRLLNPVSDRKTHSQFMRELSAATINAIDTWNQSHATLPLIQPVGAATLVTETSLGAKPAAYVWDFTAAGYPNGLRWSLSIPEWAQNTDYRIGFTAKWAPSTAGAGNVLWRFGFSSSVAGGAAATGGSTVTNVIVAAPGVALQYTDSLLYTFQPSLLTARAGSIINGILTREGSSGSDTYGGSAYLFNLKAELYRISV